MLLTLLLAVVVTFFFKCVLRSREIHSNNFRESGFGSVRICSCLFQKFYMKTIGIVVDKFPYSLDFVRHLVNAKR